MASNHDQLMQALRQNFPNCTLVQFVGNSFNLEQTVAAFNEADVVIATHGAALSFMPFIRPGLAVIEVRKEWARRKECGCGFKL